MSKSFWLGLIGGIFGFLGAMFAIFVGIAGEAFGSANASQFYALGSSAMVFSTLGIAGACLSGRKIGGWLMIISAIMVLISISLFGVLPFVLLLIGGIVTLRETRRK